MASLCADHPRPACYRPRDLIIHHSQATHYATLEPQLRAEKPMHAHDDASLARSFEYISRICRLAVVYAQHTTLGMAPKIALNMSLAESKILKS